MDVTFDCTAILKVHKCQIACVFRPTGDMQYENFDYTYVVLPSWYV